MSVCCVCGVWMAALRGRARARRETGRARESRDARARALYETVQCVACSTLVLLCQLAPVFFVHGIMQHCPTVDAQIKRFARQFDSSKLATYITEKGGKAAQPV